MSRPHNFRESWEESFKEKSDEQIADDINHISRYLSQIRTRPPYGRAHRDWATIRCAVLREGRRRGLDVSAIAPR